MPVAALFLPQSCICAAQTWAKSAREANDGNCNNRKPSSLPAIVLARSFIIQEAGQSRHNTFRKEAETEEGGNGWHVHMPITGTKLLLLSALESSPNVSCSGTKRVSLYFILFHVLAVDNLDLLQMNHCSIGL